MNDNDKRIIDNIREFVKNNTEYYDEKFNIDSFLARLFEIPTSTFSENKVKYNIHKIVCHNAMITVDRLSIFFDNVKQSEFGDSCISQYAAEVLKQEDYKEVKARRDKSKDIDRKIKKDVAHFKKNFGHTHFAKFMMTTDTPLFICACSEKSLEDMLYMFYDKNCEHKQLDLLLNSRFYANNFEILHGVISNLITAHQNEYNEDLVLNFYKQPPSANDIYFNMIGLGLYSENEICGLVHDETDYYELSRFGQDYVYEHKRNMQLLDTSPFLEMLNILPGKNNF